MTDYITKTITDKLYGVPRTRESLLAELRVTADQLLEVVAECHHTWPALSDPEFQAIQLDTIKRLAER